MRSLGQFLSFSFNAKTVASLSLTPYVCISELTLGDWIHVRGRVLDLEPVFVGELHLFLDPLHDLLHPPQLQKGGEEADQENG